MLLTMMMCLVPLVQASQGNGRVIAPGILLHSPSSSISTWSPRSSSRSPSYGASDSDVSLSSPKTPKQPAPGPGVARDAKFRNKLSAHSASESAAARRAAANKKSVKKHMNFLASIESAGSASMSDSASSACDSYGRRSFGVDQTREEDFQDKKRRWAEITFRKPIRIPMGENTEVGENTETPEWTKTPNEINEEYKNTDVTDDNVPWVAIGDIYASVMIQGTTSWKTIVERLYTEEERKQFVIMSGRHGDCPNLMESHTYTDKDGKHDTQRLVGNVWNDGPEHTRQEKVVAKELKKKYKDIEIEVHDTSELRGYNPESELADGPAVDSTYNYHDHLKNAIAMALRENKVVILAWCYSLMTFHEMTLEEHNKVAHKWNLSENQNADYLKSAEAWDSKHEWIHKHEANTNKCPIFRNEYTLNGAGEKKSVLMQCRVVMDAGINIINENTLEDLAHHGFGDLFGDSKYPKPVFGVPSPQTLAKQAREQKFEVFDKEAAVGGFDWGEQLRKSLPDAADGDDDETIAALADHAGKLMNLPDLVLKTTDENIFYKQYAKDLMLGPEAQAQKADGKTDEDFIDEAKNMIEKNKARAFTMSTDEMWFFTEPGSEPVESDVLHEAMHVLTARGGHNELRRVLGTNFMEGVNQFFTEKVFEHLKVSRKWDRNDPQHYFPAYPKYVEFVEKLAESEKYGIQMLYQAHFKGDVKPLLEAFVTSCENVNKKCWGKERTWKIEQTEDDLKQRLENTKKVLVDGEFIYPPLHEPSSNFKYLENRLLPKKAKKKKKRKTKRAHSADVSFLGGMLKKNSQLKRVPAHSADGRF